MAAPVDLLACDAPASPKTPEAVLLGGPVAEREVLASNPNPNPNPN